MHQYNSALTQNPQRVHVTLTLTQKDTSFFFFTPQTPAKRKFEFSKERQSDSGPPPAKKTGPGASPEVKAATPKHKPSPAGTPSPAGMPSPGAAKGNELTHRRLNLNTKSL